MSLLLQAINYGNAKLTNKVRVLTLQKTNQPFKSPVSHNSKDA